MKMTFGTSIRCFTTSKVFRANSGLHRSNSSMRKIRGCSSEQHSPRACLNKLNTFSFFSKSDSDSSLISLVVASFIESMIASKDEPKMAFAPMLVTATSTFLITVWSFFFFSSTSCSFCASMNKSSFSSKYKNGEMASW